MVFKFKGNFYSFQLEGVGFMILATFLGWFAANGVGWLVAGVLGILFPVVSTTVVGKIIYVAMLATMLRFSFEREPIV